LHIIGANRYFIQEKFLCAELPGFVILEQNYRTKAPYWERILEQMRASLVRRGNDNHGIYLNTHIGLAHARLSIRDIAGGGQPMTRVLDGYSYTIVYNGEIYNTRELMPELAKNRI